MLFELFIFFKLATLTSWDFMVIYWLFGFVQQFDVVLVWRLVVGPDPLQLLRLGPLQRKTTVPVSLCSPPPAAGLRSAQ